MNFAPRRSGHTWWHNIIIHVSHGSQDDITLPFQKLEDNNPKLKFLELQYWDLFFSLFEFSETHCQRTEAGISSLGKWLFSFSWWFLSNLNSPIVFLVEDLIPMLLAPLSNLSKNNINTACILRALSSIWKGAFFKNNV